MPIQLPIPSKSRGAQLFRIELSGIKDARMKFADFRDKKAMAHSREMARRMGRVYVKYLKDEAPVGKHFTWRGEPVEPKKRLRDSFTFKTFERGYKIILNLYSSVKHIRWVILGSFPYKRGRRPIRPRRKSALAFWWARKRRSVVCSVVMHPGSLPNLFHRRAFRRAKPEIEAIRRRAARWMIRSLSWEGPGIGMELG